MIQAIKSQNLLQKICQTTKGKYKQGDTIKFETEIIKSSLCDYSDAFISVTGNITVTANNNTDVAFKNCAPFSKFSIKINDAFVGEANHIHIAMPMYNLIGYSDNHSDTSGSSWQFKIDEVPDNNADLTIYNSQPFKYKAALSGKTANAGNNTNNSGKDAKIVVPLNYLSNFWRSLEIKFKFIRSKFYLELNWIEDCILSSARNCAKCEIADAKLHVLIVTLSSTDSANLAGN